MASATICQVVALLFMFSLCRSVAGAGSAVFNVSLDPQDLQSNNTRYVLIDGVVKINCIPGQESLYVYHLPEEDYDSCSIAASEKIIGSCQNSPLVIYVNKLKISFGTVVSYEVGGTYRFAAYTVVNGQVSDNKPCLDGVKFKFDVVATLPQDEVKTSSVVMSSPSPTVSYLESSSLPPSITISPTHSQSIALTTPTLMTSSVPSQFVSTRPVRPTPTTVTAPPTTSDRPTFDTRPPFNDPIVDGIADHAPSNQSLISLSLLLTTLTLFVLLRLL